MTPDNNIERLNADIERLKAEILLEKRLVQVHEKYIDVMEGVICDHIEITDKARRILDFFDNAGWFSRLIFLFNPKIKGGRKMSSDGGGHRQGDTRSYYK